MQGWLGEWGGEGGQDQVLLEGGAHPALNTSELKAAGQSEEKTVAGMAFYVDGRGKEVVLVGVRASVKDH